MLWGAWRDLERRQRLREARGHARRARASFLADTARDLLTLGVEGEVEDPAQGLRACVGAEALAMRPELTPTTASA